MGLPWLPPKAVIAHRGASGCAAENTVPAFRLAWQRGAHAVELDARRTRDGQVVVFHDARLERLFPHMHGRVRAWSYARLRALRVHGEAPIPTLAEALDALLPHVAVNIELANYDRPDDDLPDRVARILRDYGRDARVWVSSFNPLALVRFRRLLPHVPLGFLVSAARWGPWLYRALRSSIPHDAVHPWVGHADAGWVRAAARRGRPVYLYTVNEPEALRQAFARPWVAGVFTDYPARARAIRDEGLNETGPATPGGASRALV